MNYKFKTYTTSVSLKLTTSLWICKACLLVGVRDKKQVPLWMTIIIIAGGKFMEEVNVVLSHPVKSRTVY